MAITTTALKAKISRRLGSGLVRVEITDPDDWTEIFDDSFRWWNARRGLVKKQVLSLQANLNVYSMPEDFDMLVKYIPPGDSASASLSSMNAFDYEESLYYQGGMSERNRISDIVINQQFNEIVKRTLNAADDAYVDEQSYNPDSSSGPDLIVTPVPQEVGTAWVLYKSKTFNEDSLKYLMPREEELFIDLVEAQAKVVVARKRSKYADMSVPGGNAALDGDRLLEEARMALEVLEMKVADLDPLWGALLRG